MILLYATYGDLCLYNVDVISTPDDNYVSRNVSLYCKTNESDADVIQWYLNQTAVYRADVLNKSNSKPVDEYKGLVDGNFPQNDRHQLILIDVHVMFNKSSWKCNVHSPRCYYGRDSAPFVLILKGKRSLPITFNTTHHDGKHYEMIHGVY